MILNIRSFKYNCHHNCALFQKLTIKICFVTLRIANGALTLDLTGELVISTRLSKTSRRIKNQACLIVECTEMDHWNSYLQQHNSPMNATYIDNMKKKKTII